MRVIKSFGMSEDDNFNPMNKWRGIGFILRRMTISHCLAILLKRLIDPDVDYEEELKIMMYRSIFSICQLHLFEDYYDGIILSTLIYINLILLKSKFLSVIFIEISC